MWIHSTPTFSFSKQLVSITDDISRRHAVCSYFELPALWMSAKQPLPVNAEPDDLISQPVFKRMCVTHSHTKSIKDWVQKWKPTYQLVFESLPLDEIIHTVGAIQVRTTNFVDRHAAEASASQRQPSTAGVIASHDHCSHTRITVTATHTHTKTWLVKHAGYAKNQDRGKKMVVLCMI